MENPRNVQTFRSLPPAEKRAYYRKWYADHPEKRAAYAAKYNNSPKGKETQAKTWARWIENNRDKRDANSRTRRARKNGISTIIKIESNICGVCQEPLTTEEFPHPMSTSIGHEPPISRAATDGWKITVERPEHWACNQSKKDRYDTELGYDRISHIRGRVDSAADSLRACNSVTRGSTPRRLHHGEQLVR